IDRGVIKTRTDLSPLAVTDEVHHIAFAPKIAFEDTPAQVFVHEIEQLNRASMHRNGPCLTAGAEHPLDASILNAAPRQLHGQHTADRAATDDQYRDFTDLRHSSSPL